MGFFTGLKDQSELCSRQSGVSSDMHRKIPGGLSSLGAPTRPAESHMPCRELWASQTRRHNNSRFLLPEVSLDKKAFTLIKTTSLRIEIRLQLNGVAKFQRN
ncbi:hypothetical protein ElyMa_006035600 [Elysia marginata]|uniref:Uncharacterized protein n=1 Tax=Elysia marginata TaxID=1093978 RepID=A0AAV4GJ60_9GAST|nr:hypothetical protein ElyMa_006035600 [Elysia marginata]